ncbi:carboxypeptidase-like regulatory domain-containing protein [Hymenobacter sp. 102]|uniref:carboxypeptidase-like regulatory domain-containing protein n=1 Tax=Hymenobacter sp. 102 TaxID=3403152 RepID=UPI003CF60746
MRTEPERFRRRAASLLLGGALVSGAVLANTNLPTAADNTPVVADASTVEMPAAAEAAASLRMVTVKGRILDENGHPLIGATVLQKGTNRGVSTDADGNYALRVPIQQKATLQYGYAGYTEEELMIRNGSTTNVTLLPKAASAKAAKKRWLFF